MGGDGGVIAAKREYMQSCGDVFGMKGGMAKTALNRTETAELRTKVSFGMSRARCLLLVLKLAQCHRSLARAWSQNGHISC